MRFIWPGDTGFGTLRRMLRFVTSSVFMASLCAGGAQAQATMNAEEFEAYVTGKTITYQRGGQPFGEEQYYPGRKVIWAFDGDTCKFGRWYPARGLICFNYDAEIDEQCWSFWVSGGQLAALVEGGAPEGILYGTRESQAHIECPLPGLGM